jgi:primosomal protein N' (replication factor Y)
VIILEEEGHPSHKLWDQYPRLSNWYAVQQLQHIYQCHVLCTAAFPSLKAWAAVEQKDMVQVGTRPLAPKIRLMASTFADRDSHFLLPQEFLQQLKRWSAGGKNIFLLHARPGSWQTAVCRACHKAQRCPTCNLALAVRGSGSKTRLHCAQCQEDSPLPAVCAVCKKGKLRFFGPGSETLSGIVSKILPRQKIASLDAQALKSLSPAALQKLLRSHPIILGTSALLRYDLPQTFDQLVWLFPEASLLYPDVRTHERHLFELARLQGLQPGRAITVVTRQAELVREQLDTPIATLYPRLLRERKRLHYPPVNDMVRLTLKGTTAHQAMKKGVALRQLLDARLQALGDGARDIRIRGPFQSFQTRSRREHEVHILLLGNIERLTALHRGLPADVVDLDPQRII